MTRKEERELAFTIIFEKIFSADLTVTEIIDNAVEARFIENNPFAFSVSALCYDNIENIDGIISSNSVGWRIERLPKVSLAILRLAFTEILYVKDIPVKVSINEAVNLAKKFGSPEDASFINGLLGKYVREQNIQ
ncbi:MAG: transcription antitermination factor NusB [Clostridiales bacterium]|nr:transcription antitermination factor NusB [Clostridiales bacterium]